MNTDTLSDLERIPELDTRMVSGRDLQTLAISAQAIAAGVRVVLAMTQDTTAGKPAPELQELLKLSDTALELLGQACLDVRLNNAATAH